MLASMTTQLSIVIYQTCYLQRDNDTVGEDMDFLDLLPAVDDNTDGEDMDTPEASEEDMFVAEIIAELELEQNNKTMFEFENLLGCVLDDMPDPSAHSNIENN